MKKIFSRHFRIESPNIDQKHNGLRILHLTDLHIKEKTKLDSIPITVSNYNPNFVILTGDYVCYDIDNLHRVSSLLSRINIKKYATLGNHDHWTDPVAVSKALKTGGCEVLQNVSTIGVYNNVDINIVGIDDMVTKNHKIDEACQNIKVGTTIVLSHVGDVIESETIPASLIFSGHTHAGQIKLPWVTKRLLNAYGLKYHYGFHEHNGKLVYISAGFGESIPIRWRATAEICVFDLFNGPKLEYKLIDSQLIS